MHSVVGEGAPGALLPLGVTPSSRAIMLWQCPSQGGYPPQGPEQLAASGPFALSD